MTARVKPPRRDDTEGPQRSGPAGAGTQPCVVFICHAPFDSNSGGHVCHFANELAGQGRRVIVIAGGKTEGAAAFGPPLFEAWTYAETPARLKELRQLGLRHVVHAWTPRERVVRLTQTVCRALGCGHVVHLEDEEAHLTAAFSGVAWTDLSAMTETQAAKRVPVAFSQPRSADRFLRTALGITVIIETLATLTPPDRPVHLLEPGVDGALFAPDLPKDRETALRSDLGLAASTRLIVYHGNGHATNHREMFSLYTAVLILRRRGFDVKLLRFGIDHGPPLDLSYPDMAAEVSLERGFVDRSVLIDHLKLADLYVQPGSPGAFNDFRLPSKLPEFLALGRPVILPRSNLGLRLAHGEQAFVLDRADGESIAGAAARILSDPDLAERLGRDGRRFALETFDWSRNARALARFYGSLPGLAPGADEVAA